MIPPKDLEHIRTQILEAENPTFLFDDDPDGLCSFLLLWKHAKKGKGIPTRGKLSEDTVDKLAFLNTDLVVILDKPEMDQEIVDMIKVPIIHIDHHFPVEAKADHYQYYNPRVENDKDNRPTSYWAYQIVKENIWIATVGIISDWFIPEFLEEFNKEYPGLLPDVLEKPGQALFDEKFGDLAKAFAFSLKGKADDRKKCLKVLTRIEHPDEILKQTTPQGKFIFKHFDKMNRAYQELREEAMKSEADGKVLLFSYPSIQHSFTSLIANEMVYRNPDKVVIIARVKDDAVIMSLRSPDVPIPPILEKALEGLDGRGGGHDLACGGSVRNDQFIEFIRRFKEEVNK